MLEIHILELPKIKRLIKINKMQKKELLKWIKFLLIPNELEENEMENNEAIKKAKEELEKIQNDEYEQRIAELRMKHILDTNSIKVDGYEDGIEQGIKQGIKKGKKQAQKEFVKKLLLKKVSIEEIIELTGLTKEEIEKI